MAAIPVTFQGILFYSDTGVGGGPMPGGPPSPGVPTHPIYNPPGIWGPPDMPPGYWGGGMGPGVKPQPPFPGQPPQPPSGAHPSHPIWRPDLGFWGGAGPEFPPYVDIGPPGPQPPFPSQPPKPPGAPGQLPGSDPGGSGWVWAYVPGYGWMWARVPQAPSTTPPPTEGTPSPPQAGQLPSTPIATPVS